VPMRGARVSQGKACQKEGKSFSKRRDFSGGIGVAKLLNFDTWPPESQRQRHVEARAQGPATRRRRIASDLGCAPEARETPHRRSAGRRV